ncbi:Lrp/AsnC family transcriptional regulator [Massilia sp. DWR3-1-1]|uniref:Lrp/AsnC family transcriptional regulator n=1 Tax=Massilia sp. DWR3-1-1 TaxID=2804559 RepID=UPI003CF54575
MTVSRVTLDRIDRKILQALQADARLSSADLAERVALTASPCWRRVKRLESDGVICAYEARLDPKKLGYHVTAFISVSLEKSHTQLVHEFEAAVAAIPQVLSCHRISGRYDHLLMVVSEDLEAYGLFAEKYINGLPGIKEVYTSFVLKEVKAPTNPPLPPLEFA